MRHGHFVGCVHDARKRAADCTGMTGKIEATKRLGVGGIEFQRTELCKVKRFDGSVPAVGIAQGELDGDSHVRGSQVSLHAAVRKLHHGMNGALRLHDHFDLLVRHGEEVMRLDNL